MAYYTTQTNENMILFKQIIQEIDTSTIQTKYLQYILVTFEDDSDVSINSSNIVSDEANIHVKKSIKKWTREYPDIKAVRAYVDVQSICLDVMGLYNDFYGEYFMNDSQ